MNTADSETPIEAIPSPAVVEAPQPLGNRLCSNRHCRKGPDGTPGVLSGRQKYCSAYCRVDVCRRKQPKPEQIEKAKRKRRRDAKYTSHSERQKAYQARHSLAGAPRHIRESLRDLQRMRAGRAEMVNGHV